MTVSSGDMQGILLCSDFLMNSSEEQQIHQRWFPRLMELPIRWATNAPVESFPPAFNTNQVAFHRERFFSLSGIKLLPREKLFSFEPSQISDDSLTYLLESLGGQRLIIVYELSAATRSILNRASLTYIDIWLHPVRFFEDILFGFASNAHEIDSAIASFALDHRLLYLRARELELGLVRGHMRRKVRIQPNSALFVGQTLYDKALLRNGEMLKLLDFKQEFLELGDRFERVYYSRHPNVHAGDWRILAFIRRCSFARLTTAATYHLLANTELRGVYSISSSVVYEAQFFGKDTGYFYRPPIPLSIDGRVSGYTTIFQDFLSPHFWVAVLRDVFPVTDSVPIVIPNRKDKLRDALGLYYGYRNVDKLEDLHQRLWWARDASGYASRRIRAVIRGLLGKR